MGFVMNKKWINLCQLAFRANYVQYGSKLIPSIQNQSAQLVIFSRSMGNNTRKKILDKCKTYQVPYLEVDPLEMDQLTSKNLVALSILNKDFAQKIWNDRKGMVIVDGLQQTKKETEPQSLCTKQQSSAAHKKGWVSKRNHISWYIDSWPAGGVIEQK